MTLTSTPATFADLNPLRATYLASLSEPQEFYCERLSREGHPFLIRDSGKLLGYFITDDTSTLVEFHPTESDPSVDARLLDLIVDQAGIRRAYCKTFDERLHAVCSKRAVLTTTKGLLYRRIGDSGFAPDPTVRSRLASDRDVPAIIAIDDGFFREGTEASSYASAKQMFLYETDTGLAGCGLVQQVTRDREAYDIGMMVAPVQRRRGIGRHIVQHLVQLCLSTGKRPIAGCSVANIASQRCLESAGFRSEHQLVEFAW